ncbi:MULTISPECIES: hypothetical protein [Streptomyces]|uniref:Microcin J25-processing protein McjB C-terminal domain-containing protein n=1 Tax=Streptomyces morookaense TaxID=1970 RepID=A0A7Y7B4G1_STRMO|nr:MULTISPECIES: hypothetical protein [Streptomyces]MCC2274061.1 hypothetical protein [Streptomyces sp. ET3-23]NVK78861.1 hypothetical protein [Streptomyces morookaense]GHF35668.1 hypothetical protein GCM10010359_42910 [Streptomyces morookaense]
MIAELRTSLRLRRHTLPELIEQAERSGACTATGRPPVTAVLIMRRLLSGFGTSMDETAAVVAALRQCGYPAQLVLGAEPLPANDGEYPVFTWVAVDGVPVDIDRPPDTYLIELARFPECP